MFIGWVTDHRWNTSLLPFWHRLPWDTIPRFPCTDLFNTLKSHLACKQVHRLVCVAQSSLARLEEAVLELHASNPCRGRWRPEVPHVEVGFTFRSGPFKCETQSRRAQLGPWISTRLRRCALPHYCSLRHISSIDCVASTSWHFLSNVHVREPFWCGSGPVCDLLDLPEPLTWNTWPSIPKKWKKLVPLLSC